MNESPKGIQPALRHTQTQAQWRDAIKSGVKVVACENTMSAQKLVKADMNSVISYVPAGVIQIMNRQNDGWAYVRP